LKSQIPVSAITGPETEACGRIAWTSELRKLEGVGFVDLTQEVRSQDIFWQAAVATDRAIQRGCSNEK
jgi:hypothetical protein